MEISLDFKQGFVFKYALSLTCLAIAPHVLYRSVAFQSCWEAHCLQQNLGQVITCHFFTLFCSSIGKKKYGGERDSISVAQKCPCWATLSFGFSPIQSAWHFLKGAAGWWHYAFNGRTLSLRAAVRYQCMGRANSIIMAISKFLPDALVVCTTS